LRGHELVEADVEPGAVVVSRSFAERHWPGKEAVGRRLRLRLAGRDLGWMPVVGVVGDVRQWIDTPGEPTVYWPSLGQPALAFALRTSGDPASLAGPVRSAVARLDPQQPILDLRTAEQRLEGSQQLSYERFRTTVMVTFGIAALALVALGIYGVVRYTVGQRLPELAIRLALGAHPRQVGRLVLVDIGRWVAAGATAGLALSLGVARHVAGRLYGAPGEEPFVIAVAAATIAAVTLVAVAGPLRRARRADPLAALRDA
jgi:predicted lysophospholipase L1 biosynthesis ABC-type transport system permease subunit